MSLTSLAVFPSVAWGKVSVPQVVTPSYTRAYHAELLRDPSITYLVLRSRDCPSFSVPGNVIRRMPASVIWVPSPASVGRTGGRNGGKFENDKK
ncbi:unnamed protein product [Staurois parvus]|uniref:Secreted protein n=1 Tax=Staurois parvus TaxID=386267 RepID=A0ABN9FHV7_9NEOB|nr:unnamed protein product [Staurois parvus]